MSNTLASSRFLRSGLGDRVHCGQRGARSASDYGPLRCVSGAKPSLRPSAVVDSEQRQAPQRAREPDPSSHGKSREVVEREPPALPLAQKRLARRLCVCSEEATLQCRPVDRQAWGVVACLLARARLAGRGAARDTPAWLWRDLSSSGRAAQWPRARSSSGGSGGLPGQRRVCGGAPNPRRLAFELGRT